MKLNKVGLGKGLLFWIFSLVAAITLAETDRPNCYGFAPAIPLTTQLPALESPVPIAISEKSMDIILEIDKKGAVKSAKPKLAEDSAFARYLFSSVGKIPFEPALKNGGALNSFLPILFTYNPRHRSARVEYPVDSSCHVSNSDLYFQAMELNGLILPRLKKFPSYFGWTRSPDSLAALPYVVISINLDENGKLMNSALYSTNIPAYTTQTLAASLWADYSPLIVDGQPAPSRCFLSVFFFPQINYPTKPVDYERDTSLNWYDRWKARLVPDTVGYLHPAIPSNAKFEELPLVGEEKSLNAVVSVNLIIDSLG
ncbi:MAG: hypothetical protein ACREBV_06955, partial [Candidatus Zixiibacteriota bacterium]